MPAKGVVVAVVVGVVLILLTVWLWCAMDCHACGNPTSCKVANGFQSIFGLPPTMPGRIDPETGKCLGP